MATDKFEINTIVVQASGLVTADVDGEKVMMSVNRGKYFGLDAVGSYIWELLGRPVAIKQVIAVLLDAYEVDEDTCRRDLLIFLNNMYDKGVIEIV